MKRITFGVITAAALFLVAEPAMAQGLASSNIMDDVLDRFHGQTATWKPAIEAAASRLFWALATISMVWTFGIMALRKADIGEFFAEFIKFIMFTGFYWWLLTNAMSGMNIAGTIVSSLQGLGVQAGGLSDSKLGPSSIIDLGFDLYNKTVLATAELGWREFATSLVMQLLAIAVLVILAVISINLLLIMASAWILLYAGIFFLGFGGSKWTSDMAINYYKTVLGIASQLMAMILLVAIGKQFLQHYIAQISNNMASQELVVMLVVALILLFLVNKVPSMISGIVTGASIGAIGGAGNFGAGAAVGAAVGAASMAAGGAAMAGKAAMGAATGGAGAVSALQAAFQAAQGGGSDGGDVPGLGSIGGSSGGDEAGTASETPFAQAAGLDLGGGSDGAAGLDGVSGDSGSDGGSGDSGSDGGSGDSGSDGGSSDGGSDGGSSDTSTGGGDSGTSKSSGLSRAAGLAAGTAGALASAVGSSIKSDFQKRVGETAGGKLAAKIKSKSEGGEE